MAVGPCLKKILLGTYGSWDAGLAAVTALGLVRLTGSELHVGKTLDRGAYVAVRARGPAAGRLPG